MTQLPIPYDDVGRSMHQFSVNAKQTVIRISVPDGKLKIKDYRVARAMSCLQQHGVKPNVVYFKKGELCVCADKNGQNIDEAGKQVREGLGLGYTSDSGFTLVTMRGYSEELFQAFVPPGKEVVRRKVGQEMRIVMQLKRKDETIKL